MNTQFEKSKILFSKAKDIIPLASQTFSKSYLQYPHEAPLFLSHGKGGRVWDVDGNEYVDLVNGLLSVVLGYCDPDVDAAIIEQLGRGINFSLATELEYQLAQRLVTLIPCAQMVRFGKNGSDVTTAAVRVARAYTHRNKIAVCGYHGWHDWYIGSTTMHRGVPKDVAELTYRFQYNQIESLERIFDEHSGDIAAVILEPMNTCFPEDNFLQKVRDLCTQHGTVFILDEIITGFRLGLGGAQSYFGVTPDLATFGKSMGNGMPISAIVGKTEIMQLYDRIFFSATFGGEALSLAAAICVIDKMISKEVVPALMQKGHYLKNKVELLIAHYDLSHLFSLNGMDSWKIIAISDHATLGISKEQIKYLFLKEMIKNGVLIQSSHNVSFAHTQSDLDKILEAYDKTFASIACLNDSKKAAVLKDMKKIQPVFSVR